MKKKAQSWTIEFILALLLFSSAVILSVKTVSNIYKSDDFKNVMKESEILSDYLMTEGIPHNWTSTDFIRPGLTTNGRITTHKIANLTATDYTGARSGFGVNYEFYIFFKDNNGIIDIFGESSGTPGICGYGSPKVNVTYSGGCQISLDFNRENLITMERLMIYNNSIVSLVVYAWN